MLNLIIHGEIVSRTSYRSKRCYELKGKEPIYNAVANIKNILINYSDVFENIVISTWNCSKETKKEIGILKNKYNFEILYLEMPSFEQKFFWKFNDSRYYQNLQILSGLKYLKKLNNIDDSITIKTRVDQFIDWKIILEQINNNKKELNDKILFPYVLTGELFSLGDFFHAGNTNLLFKYYSNLFYQFNIPCGSKSNHVHQSQKYIDLIENITNKSNSFTRFFIPIGSDLQSKKRIPIDLNSLLFWRELVLKHFIISNKGWHSTSYWRDQPLNFVEEKMYMEDILDKDIYIKKMKIKWKRKISKGNIFSSFIFGKLPIYSQEKPLSKLNFYFNYYLRRILLKI